MQNVRFVPKADIIPPVSGCAFPLRAIYLAHETE
jgi:hypothetical protein